jgi:hypothetical protein
MVRLAFVPTLLGELDANRGSADPHSLNYNDEGSSVVHHVTGLDPAQVEESRLRPRKRPGHSKVSGEATGTRPRFLEASH